MGLIDWIRRRKPASEPAGRPYVPSQARHHLATPPARPIVQAPLGFAVVDVETTGLSSSRDRVVEIAVIHTDPWGRPVDEWTTLVNPQGPVGATHIHGITAADVRHAPAFADIAGELIGRLTGRAIVAHNIRFDVPFIAAELARAGWQIPSMPTLCTLDASWTYLPGLHRRRLQDCCHAVGVNLDQAHSALGDTRATTGLLSAYLGSGHPAASEHLRLPGHALAVRWPAAPRGVHRPALRQPAAPAPVPAAPGTLAALLDDLPLTDAIEQGSPVEAGSYLELLAQVLEDRVITDDEAKELARLAGDYGLSRDHVHAAHRGFLLALAHRAVDDGKVTHAERDDLLTVAGQLDLDRSMVKTVLDEAQAALIAVRSQACKPLPASWQHGEPVRVGQSVVFTGCEERQRARLERRARAAGLRVASAVSGKTAVLVTDEPGTTSRKGVDARQHGTRVVSPDVFAELVKYIQPGDVTTRTPRRAQAPAAGSPEALASPARADDSPAAIRAWARRQGHEVNARGRLSTELVDAFRAAHGLPATPAPKVTYPLGEPLAPGELDERGRGPESLFGFRRVATVRVDELRDWKGHQIRGITSRSLEPVARLRRNQSGTITVTLIREVGPGMRSVESIERHPDVLVDVYEPRRDQV